jgi:hemolysin activation/secretion protein
MDMHQGKPMEKWMGHPKTFVAISSTAIAFLIGGRANANPVNHSTLVTPEDMASQVAVIPTDSAESLYELAIPPPDMPNDVYRVDSTVHIDTGGIDAGDGQREPGQAAFSDTPQIWISQQPNPNDERFLQNPPEPLPAPVEDNTPVLPDTTPDVTPILPGEPNPGTPNIPVSSIEVLGSTIYNDRDFAPIIEPLEGRSVTLGELQTAADAVTQLYLNDGYLTSRAILVDQPVTDGVIRIQVVEGSLSDIQIEGTRRLNQRYIRQRIQLGAGSPLRAEELEEQLRLLRTNPLFENVEASLRAGGELGQSILVVRVTEADPLFGSVGVDNYSPPSVGSERTTFDIGYRNLTGIGDEFTFSYDRTTRGGANIFQFGYQVPLNAMDGTLQLRTVLDNNQIVQEEFDELGIEGESELYEISFRQPLVRSTREEFALSLGFSFKDGQTFLFNDIPTPFGIGPDEEGVSRTSVVRFGQDYVRRDPSGAWALRSQFSFGLDWLDATVNPDLVPDSRFVSWLGQIQRVQRLGNDHLLILQADLQLTPDSLLPSEQFVVGGGQSLRGFRQNARSGDNGFRFSGEDRVTLTRDESGAATFQLAPFIDMGSVWNDGNNPNTLPDQTFLVGAGFGAIWVPVPDFVIRFDYGVPLVNLADRDDNFQDDGIYFSVNYQF